jgi:hypothetical protein
MTQARTWVGLDVHVSGTVAAVLDRDSGELCQRRLSGCGEEIAAFVAGCARRIAVAAARELAGFCWAVAVENRPPWALSRTPPHRA